MNALVPYEKGFRQKIKNDIIAKPIRSPLRIIEKHNDKYNNSTKRIGLFYNLLFLFQN